MKNFPLYVECIQLLIQYCFVRKCEIIGINDAMVGNFNLFFLLSSVNIHQVFPVIPNFSKTAVWWGFGWAWSEWSFIFFNIPNVFELYDLISGSFCCWVHKSPLCVSAKITLCHLGNSQTGPSQNTPASQLTGWPEGWETGTGSRCCGNVPPGPQRCVWLLCWWCCSAGGLPVRTWGWKTGESFPEGCIAGSYREKKRGESLKTFAYTCRIWLEKCGYNSLSSWWY